MGWREGESAGTGAVDAAWSSLKLQDSEITGAPFWPSNLPEGLAYITAEHREEAETLG